jgi:hypothetical protein
VHLSSSDETPFPASASSACANQPVRCISMSTLLGVHVSGCPCSLDLRPDTWSGMQTRAALLSTSPAGVASRLPVWEKQSSSLPTSVLLPVKGHVVAGLGLASRPLAGSSSPGLPASLAAITISSRLGVMKLGGWGEGLGE